MPRHHLGHPDRGSAQNFSASGRLGSGRNTGCFVGASQFDYFTICLKYSPSLSPFHGVGNAHSSIAGRLSFIFNCSGPSVAIDTACSSSLVSLSVGLKYLTERNCRSILNCGVNLILKPAVSVMFSAAGMLAQDARCKTLDAAADGYVRSEGLGSMMISSQTHVAVLNLDLHVAVIGSVQINQDARSSSLTAPNGPAQQSILLDALKRAELERFADGVQLHGTGTPLGDPIETGALASALSTALSGRSHQRVHRVGLSTIKSSIGHTEAAAGICGTLQVLQGLWNHITPAITHLAILNPHVLRTLDSGASVLPTMALRPLLAPTDSKLSCGVSSFAFQGTNAHGLFGTGRYRAADTKEPVVESFESRFCWALTVPTVFTHSVVDASRTTSVSSEGDDGMWKLPGAEAAGR